MTPSEWHELTANAEAVLRVDRTLRWLRDGLPPGKRAQPFGRIDELRDCQRWACEEHNFQLWAAFSRVLALVDDMPAPPN